MSNTETFYDIDGNPIEVETPNVRQMREHIKTLEDETARLKALETENAQLKQGEAIRSAGIELDEIRRKAFEAAHNGEWTPEAVRDTAVKLGWAAPPPPPVPPEEVAGFQRMDAAYTGGTTTPPDPEAALDAKLAQANSEQEFLELYRNSGRPIETF